MSLYKCNVQGVRLSVCHYCGLRACVESDLGEQNADRRDVCTRSWSPLDRMFYR